jgi:hypothetical protein
MKRGTKTAELVTGSQAQSRSENVVEVPGIVAGLAGKAKGLKGDIFERGLLNPATFSGCTLLGTKGCGRRGGRVEKPSVAHGQMRRLQDLDLGHERAYGGARTRDGAGAQGLP